MFGVSEQTSPCEDEDSQDSESVYEGFFPLWDRKWLFEARELWVFPKGMRDMEFYELDLEIARVQRARKAAARAT